MKKIAPLAAALAVLALLPSSAESAVTFRFAFGAGIVRTGDLAAGIQGYNDYLSSVYGSDFHGPQEAPRWGIDPSAEIIIGLGRRFGIGLGFGYASYRRSSQLSYSVADAIVYESLTAGITEVPLQLNLHFTLPLSDRLELDAWAGPGIVLSRLKWDTSMVVRLEEQNGTDRFTFQADRPAFGAQAGIAIACRILPALDLTAEVSGRLAAADGFTGSWTENGSGALWAFNDSGEASVWAFDWMYASKPYRQLSFQQAQPAGTNVNAAESARIGLSGMSFKIGIRLRLGAAVRADR
jgi:hypothetical protein